MFFSLYNIFNVKKIIANLVAFFWRTGGVFALTAEKC